MSSAAITRSFYTMIEQAPVSSNNLYMTVRNRRILTDEGRAFKDAVTQEVARQLATLNWAEAVDEVYLRGGHVALDIVLHLPLRNASFKPGARTKKGALQSPYKKRDATSYIKAIEDAVADATGIDDSANVDISIRKRHSDKPYVEIAYTVCAAKEA